MSFEINKTDLVFFFILINITTKTVLLIQKQEKIWYIYLKNSFINKFTRFAIAQLQKF